MQPDLVELVVVLVVYALASARVAVLLVSDTILDRPRRAVFRLMPPEDNLTLGYLYQSHDRHGVALPGSLKRRAWLTSELLTCTRCLTVWTTAAVYALDHVIGRADVLPAAAIVAAMHVAAYAARRV